MILSWKMPFRFARSMYHAALYALQGRPIIAPKLIQNYRRSVCENCEFRQEFQCGRCQCLLSLKTLVSSDRCPDGRWPALTNQPIEEES